MFPSRAWNSSINANESAGVMREPESMVPRAMGEAGRLKPGREVGGMS